jgi:ABC-type Fe3+/spermidine/putrescine transport system ATPase subunit
VTIAAGGQQLGVRLRQGSPTPGVDSPVAVYFRPENISLVSEPRPNTVPGAVQMRTFHGNTVQYLVDTPLGEFLVNQDYEAEQFERSMVHVVLSPERLILIESANE